MSCEVCSTPGNISICGVQLSVECDEKGWYILVKPSTPIMGWKVIQLGYEPDEHSVKTKAVLLSSLLRKVSEHYITISSGDKGEIVDNEQKTEIRIQEISAEMHKAGKRGSLLKLGATALFVIENKERVAPVDGELVPTFFVTKIHNGNIVSEQFI